jgi:TolA-binding protein
MNRQGDDLERLVASIDVTDLERRLLESWSDERPSPSARGHTLAVLGLGSAVTVTGAAAGASVAPKALAAGWLAIAKWTAIGAVAVTAAGAGTYAVVHRTPTVSVAPPPTPKALATSGDDAPRLEPQTAIELGDTKPHGQSLTVRTVTPAASSLAQQIAAVDRARSALDTGDAARARRLADSYESEYPGGAFTQEAEVVRIDALVREGNRPEAERVAKRFLGAYPKSPHASRVRALLGYD